MKVILKVKRDLVLKGCVKSLKIVLKIKIIYV